MIIGVVGSIPLASFLTLDPQRPDSVLVSLALPLLRSTLPASGGLGLAVVLISNVPRFVFIVFKFKTFLVLAAVSIVFVNILIFNVLLRVVATGRLIGESLVRHVGSHWLQWLTHAGSGQRLLQWYRVLLLGSLRA